QWQSCGNAALMAAPSSPVAKAPDEYGEQDMRAAALFAALVLAAMSMSAQAQTKVRIGKPQAGAFQFVPVDVGLEVGIFKKHGLEVESSDFGGGPRVQQALTAGALDLAIGSGPELAMIAKGAPEIAVAAL